MRSGHGVLGVAAVALGALCVAAVSCGHPSSSMIDHAAVRSAYQAEFFADGDLLVLKAAEPGGTMLVPFDPLLDGNNVVLTVGVASGGNARVRTHCISLTGLSPAPGWWQRLLWREPDGGLVEVGHVRHDEVARQLAADCRHAALRRTGD
jgi:hypothetical protein